MQKPYQFSAMTTLNLITFASVFQEKTESAIKQAHSELFEALSKYYEVKVVFEEGLPTFRPKAKDMTLLFIATGGTEGMVVRRYKELSHPLVFLTDGKANSLAASMELSSWVRQQGDTCAILHGSIEVILRKVQLLEERKKLSGLRIGVIGEPSDWLVSSGVSYAKAKEVWGVEYVDLDLQQVVKYYESEPNGNEVQAEADSFIQKAQSCREPNREEVIKAMRLYRALKKLVEQKRLNALTVQCFRLIPTTHTTGCLALALLNDQGIVAGCEGDLQSIFTMLLCKKLTDRDAFMANPAYIDTERDEVLFAHCTIGLNQCQQYIVRSHFESQSGVAIQGIMPTGAVTVIKFGGLDLDEAFICDGELLDNQDDERKCRTQVRVRLDRKGVCEQYFLSNNIGNHHIIIFGHHARQLLELCQSMGVKVR